MAALLVVDDNPTNLTLLCALLFPCHAVRAVMSGERALQTLAEGRPPDLILLDLKLSGMDGFEVLQRLKADPATAAIPVVIVTALDDAESEERGLALGAADYLTRPLRPRTALARVRMQLELKAAREALLGRNAELVAPVQARLHENSQMQDASILALAQLAETRDPETGNHLRRTQGYMRVLCKALANHPRFAGYLTPACGDLLVKSAPLHDIGKVGIPDQILLKPGPLSADEWIVMKSHCTLGQHFDPDVVDAFVAHQDEFQNIALALADSPEELQAHLARLTMPAAAALRRGRLAYAGP